MSAAKVELSDHLHEGKKKQVKKQKKRPNVYGKQEQFFSLVGSSSEGENLFCQQDWPKNKTCRGSQSDHSFLELVKSVANYRLQDLVSLEWNKKKEREIHTYSVLACFVVRAK